MGLSLSVTNLLLPINQSVNQSEFAYVAELLQG